ncbi:hypothetical protein SDRG_15469 [Saprolegnia diclina VS20]|uniref:K Homology domain-containing protein n=1 Tax=Saprolegnia diclina (strain VS20) TaxID=1156394 RepID=T0Q049_SAPDV|nr:hypothetical protein SDRG_15469 [Saprolegnia diclina VS20]EQC26740.1 hypothetical protein SDRG_15469 [Saprolegnia diclina VS20]|eukprot:XP_008619864.1 hypothetical protein SDRG_15469 [Saprolegnia diclina VS20]
MGEAKSYTKTFMLVPGDVAQILNARSGTELKELARSASCLMYLVDAHVYKDCRILCVSGTPRQIDDGMHVLVARIQEILRDKYTATFETVKYMHDKSVVHIRSDFAAYLLEHASARLQQVASATHTRVYIKEVEEMVMALPMRRLHITGTADNVKAACNRLHQVQAAYEALPADPSRLVYALRLVLLDRDVMDVDNSRMSAMYQELRVEAKVLRSVPNLPQKTLFVLTGTLENLYAAHTASIKAISTGYERVRLRKEQRDREYAAEQALRYGDKKTDYIEYARHSSRERSTTKAILPPPSSSSPLAVHVTPVVPPPTTPFPYQPVLAPMPSAWTANEC